MASDVYLEALCEDTGCAVLVVSRGGEIRSIHHGSGEMGLVENPAHIGDLVACPVSAERYGGVIDDALTAREVRHIEGFLSGRYVRLTCRPLEDQDAALVVVMPSPSPADHQVVSTAARRDCPELGKLRILTAREFEVLRLIGLGLTTSQIADVLGRSAKTIEWHRVSLGNKLGVSNRVELARIAIHVGLCACGEMAEGTEPQASGA